jgi:hypothetical protein
VRRSAPCRSNGNQGRISWFPLWLPLGPAKKACRERQASSVTAHFRVYRAGDRTRTGDVQLGKLAFYQLNYARVPALKIALADNPFKATSVVPAPRYRLVARPFEDAGAVAPRLPFCRDDTRVRQSRTSLMSCRTPRLSAMLNARS